MIFDYGFALRFGLRSVIVTLALFFTNRRDSAIRSAFPAETVRETTASYEC